MDQVESALKYLSLRGDRITKYRKDIVEMIFSYKKPISAPELIHELKKKNSSLNKTTVYRELSFLTNAGVVKEVAITTGMKHYESSYLPHHHHLVCTECGMVEEIVCSEVEGPMEQLLLRVATEGFFVKKHSLKFYGACERCVGK